MTIRVLSVLALVAIFYGCDEVDPEGDEGGRGADAGQGAGGSGGGGGSANPDDCAEFCSPDVLEIANDCVFDEDEAIDRADCLEICADEGLAPAGDCLAEAAGCDAAFECFEDEGGEGGEGGDAEGPVEFEIQGTDALMRGVIDGRIGDTVQALIDDHPDVDRIVLLNCPGSDDDAANLMASRLVREAGLATHVPANGEIASGGTDFFLAGSTRSADVAGGARIGVHSWAGENISGADLPRDDPEHQTYLDYYAEMGIPADFYWFTLEAAPPEGMHWMTADEVARFEMTTE